MKYRVNWGLGSSQWTISHATAVYVMAGLHVRYPDVEFWIEEGASDEPQP